MCFHHEAIVDFLNVIGQNGSNFDSKSLSEVGVTK